MTTNNIVFYRVSFCLLSLLSFFTLLPKVGCYRLFLTKRNPRAMAPAAQNNAQRCPIVCKFCVVVAIFLVFPLEDYLLKSDLIRAIGGTYVHFDVL